MTCSSTHKWRANFVRRFLKLGIKAVRMDSKIDNAMARQRRKPKPAGTQTGKR